MSASHWHLVLNHLPVVGSIAAVLLLGWAWIRNLDELKRVALGALVLVALSAIPAFLTGEPAGDSLTDMPGISKRWMSNHEEMAEVALWVTLPIGALALGALVFFRKSRRIPRWFVGVMLLLALAVFGSMARTANMGGKIHHPELRGDAAPAAPATDVER